MKTLLIASAAALMLGTVGSASAATWGFDAYGNPLVQAPVPAENVTTPDAHGRVFYGVGGNNRSTATGDPVGGYADRN